MNDDFSSPQNPTDNSQAETESPKTEKTPEERPYRDFGERVSREDVTAPQRPRAYTQHSERGEMGTWPDRSERPVRPARSDTPERPVGFDRERPRSAGARDNDSRDGRGRDYGDRPFRPRTEGGRPAGENRPHPYGDRPFRDTNRDNRDDNRSGRSERSFGDRPNRNTRGGPMGAIIDIDKELLGLIAKRARFLSRLRDAHGNILAPTEKTLRTAWQDAVVEHSRDPRLARDMFLLLQEIEALPEEEEKRPAFTLNPSTKALQATLPAPLSSRQCRILALLAASSGQAMTIANAPKDDASVDLIKTLHQAGADIAFVPEKGLILKAGKPLTGFSDRIFHSGDDFFNFCLLSSYMIGRPANVKFTGGREMRLADLSALRHFLPTLGVRLTTVVPKTEGLPVRIECSNMLPPEVAIPEDLPADTVLALLVGAATWETPVCFDLSAHADAVALLDEAERLFALANVRTERDMLRYTVHTGYAMPERPQPEIDLTVASCLLSLPAFVGGEFILEGNWPQTPQAEAARAMLHAAGLDCIFEENALRAVKAARPVETMPVLPPELAPLGLAIQTFGVAHGECPATVDTALDASTVSAFLTHVGLEKDAQGMLVEQRVPSQPEAWITPSAVWGMAFAMASFTRPGLKMLNPGLVTASVPTFWTVFNTLPNPIQEKPKVMAHGKAPRRRVMAGNDAGTSGMRSED